MPMQGFGVSPLNTSCEWFHGTNAIWAQRSAWTAPTIVEPASTAHGHIAFSQFSIADDILGVVASLMIKNAEFQNMRRFVWHFDSEYNPDGIVIAIRKHLWRLWTGNPAYFYVATAEAKFHPSFSESTAPPAWTAPQNHRKIGHRLAGRRIDQQAPLPVQKGWCLFHTRFVLMYNSCVTVSHLRLV